MDQLDLHGQKLADWSLYSIKLTVSLEDKRSFCGNDKVFENYDHLKRKQISKGGV